MLSVIRLLAASLLVLFACGFGNPAYAETTMTEYVQRCGDETFDSNAAKKLDREEIIDRVSDASFCVGFAEALLGAVIWEQSLNREDQNYRGTCPPDGISLDQIRRILIRFSELFPAMNNTWAAPQGMAALNSAFPCDQ